MRKLIIKLFIFTIPIVISAICIEAYNRVNNTFYAKNKYIEKNKDSIEVLLLGSSQTWRAINPKYLKVSTAPLSHGGSAFNIDYLLFKKFVKALPKLQVVILEVSYHSFEDYRDESWNKNHLFYKYYGINNYKDFIPFSERFLVTANPKGYINRMISSTGNAELGEYNEYGYITTANTTINETGYSSNALKSRHILENLKHYKRNKVLLNEIVGICSEKGIDIVLFSPPKHKGYNQYNSKGKLKRRDQIFEQLDSNQKIHNWNYEKKYENADSLFYNEDHLNIKGSKIMSIELDFKLRNLLKIKARK